MCSTFSLAMPVFTSSAEIKGKSLTAAVGRHTHMHSGGAAPWWRSHSSPSVLPLCRASTDHNNWLLWEFKTVMINIPWFFFLNNQIWLFLLILEAFFLFQNMAVYTIRLSSNPDTFNAVQTDLGISRPHSHPHPPPGRKRFWAEGNFA